MQNLGFTEADWKLFRKRLPEWQERYMEVLVEDYMKFLSSNEPASSKFWELEKRLKMDKRKTGVLAEGISRSNMKIIMMNLIDEGAIAAEDFNGFSDDFREQLLFYFERMKQD